MNRNRPGMVDIAFGFTAPLLPANYEWPLYREVARMAPWIREFSGAGIHPMRGPRNADGSTLVPRRAKLVIRLPHDRLCAASALEGAALRIGEVDVTLTRATVRKLSPAPTLYAPRVATGVEEERAFSAVIERELAALGIARRFICGRRESIRLDGASVATFGVAVHGLSEAESLLLQDAGLGLGRAIGCGLLVPHKTIAMAP